MKRSIIGLLILSFISTSCSNKVVADFEITNNTEFTIDSLKVEPNLSDKGKYISLKKGEKTKYKSDMTSIDKIDGAYQISFLLNGISKTEVFGYYSNGYPLERITKIEIEKDTILFDQILEK